MNILDTDVLSHLQKKDRVGAEIETHLRAFPDQDFRITTVNVYEMMAGAIDLIQQSGRKRRDPLSAFLLLHGLYDYLVAWHGRVLPYDAIADRVYRGLTSRIRQELGNDARLGAIALATGAAVWTCNVSDYRQVPGLIVYAAETGQRVL